MGYTRTERVLPVGMVVTAIGEVAKVKDVGAGGGALLRHQGEMLVLRAPQHGPFILSKRSLGSIVSSLNEVSRICKYLAFGFTTVGVTLVAVKAVRGCLSYYRQKQLRCAGMACKAWCPSHNQGRASGGGQRTWRGGGGHKRPGARPAWAAGDRPVCSVPDQPLQRGVCAVWAHVCVYFVCGAHGQVSNLSRQDAGDPRVSDLLTLLYHLVTSATGDEVVGVE